MYDKYIVETRCVAERTRILMVLLYTRSISQYSVVAFPRLTVSAARLAVDRINQSINHWFIKQLTNRNR